MQMVLVGQIIKAGIQVASRYFPRGARYTKDFARFDRQLHGSVFGRSGGRGFRHGRDAGLAITGATQGFRGDDLDAPSYRPPITPGKFKKAYSRRGNVGRFGRTKCYPNYRVKRRSSFR